MTAASSHARAHLIEFDLNAEDGCRAREWAVRLEFPPGGRGDAGESDVAGQALDVIFFRRRAGAMRGLAAGY
jgi:hypothetical protein